jgi:hypothetical protein
MKLLLTDLYRIQWPQKHDKKSHLSGRFLLKASHHLVTNKRWLARTKTKPGPALAFTNLELILKLNTI